MMLNQTVNTGIDSAAALENPPEFPAFTTHDNNKESVSASDRMLHCLVCVDKLTSDELKKWTHQDTDPSQSPYQLRPRPGKVNASKWDRKVKHDINYHIQSESSQDDDKDISVHPGKWHSRCHIKKYLPSHEPSRAKIAAQQIIGDQHQAEAAKALISLFHSDSATGNNTESTSSGSSQTHTPSVTSKDDSSVIMTENDLVDDTENASEKSNKKDPSEKEDSEENLPLARLLEKEEDDLPLSVVRDRMNFKTKPFFKMTAYELIKHKRSRVFKCLKCVHTETSQKGLTHTFVKCMVYLHAMSVGKNVTQYLH